MYGDGYAGGLLKCDGAVGLTTAPENLLGAVSRRISLRMSAAW